MKKISLIILFTWSIVAKAQSGLLWDTIVDVASNTFGNLHPRIVTDHSGNPMIIWGQFSTNEVHFSRWDDSTSTFTTPITVNPVTIPAFTASWAGPDIASHGDTVYIVYKGTPEDTSHIYISRSFDAGQNFTGPFKVDLLVDSVSKYPTIVTDSAGNPVVAYMRFEPGFVNAGYVVCRSNDYGVTFLHDTLASMYIGSNVDDCSPAAIITQGNRSVTLYRDNFNDFRTIWAGISNDNCTSFPFGISVDHTSWLTNACPASGPDGILIGDSLYSVFMSGVSGDARCYLNRTSMSTQNSLPESLLNDSTPLLSSQNFPRIANYGNRVAIVCRQSVNGNGELSFFYTNDITQGISNVYDTLTVGSVSNTDVAITADNVFVVWQDDNSETVKFRRGSYNTTGINDVLVSNDISVFPIPATDYVTIRLSKGIEPKDLEIFTLTGQEIQISYTNSIEGIRCNIQNLTSGIYILNLKDTKSKTHRTKILVE